MGMSGSLGTLRPLAKAALSSLLVGRRNVRMLPFRISTATTTGRGGVRFPSRERHGSTWWLQKAQRNRTPPTATESWTKRPHGHIAFVALTFLIGNTWRLKGQMAQPAVKT